MSLHTQGEGEMMMGWKTIEERGEEDEGERDLEEEFPKLKKRKQNLSYKYIYWTKRRIDYINFCRQKIKQILG